jgi:hypothetical protein
MPFDRDAEAHKQWLGFLQEGSAGLVVSIPALLAKQAILNSNVVDAQRRLIDLLAEPVTGDETADGDEEPWLDDLPRLTRELLGWDAADLAGAPGAEPLPQDLAVALPEYGEVLRPTYAVGEEPDAGPWLLLVQRLPRGQGFDAVLRGDGVGWAASPQVRLERLLREKEVPLGLIDNGLALRLVYAPRGETSGYLTFPLAPMTTVAGRPILSGLLLPLLLGSDRLFTLPTEQRLRAIVDESRRYQAAVST